MPDERHRFALFAALAYLVLGGLWIAFSDNVLQRALVDALPGDLSRYQTVKGLIFIAASASLLYLFVLYAQRREKGIRERVEHLLEASPSILYVLRVRDGAIRSVWVSDSVTRLLGYSAEEAMQWEWWKSHLHPDDRERALQGAADLLEGRGIDHEYRFLDRQGNTRWLRDCARVVKDAQRGDAEVIGVLLDITARRQEEEQQRLLAAAFASVEEGVMILDHKLIIESVNAAFATLMGYEQEDLIGRHPRIFNSGRHPRDFLEELQAALESGRAWSGEVWNRTRDGGVVPCWVNVRVAAGGEPDTDRLIVIYRDIRDLKVKEAELEKLMHFDPLTNLPNAQLLRSTLEHALQKAQRRGGSLALLLLDLNDLRSVNDSLGHDSGDAVLAEVARRLGERVPPTAFIGRLGGDEFVTAVEDCESEREVERVARAMLASLDEPVAVAGREVFVEACIGISLYPRHGDDPATLLRVADTALRRAKQHPTGRVRFYAEEMGNALTRRLDLTAGLRRALERGEFVLHYQPQYDLHNAGFAGVEALLRWDRAETGLVSPGEFIPVAEASGLILPIGDWVLEQAARQCREWLDAGFDPVHLAVNVSASQFAHHDLGERITALVKKWRLPPHCLGIEIVESILVDRPEEVEATLHRLKKAGVQIAVDDFGTGFSSFSYLSRFPLDTLKIDASFISRIDQSDKDNRIIVSMIELAHNLNMRVVAEGVETAKQREFLRSEGCDCIQGYLYGGALPASDLVGFAQGYADVTPGPRA